MIVQKNTSQNTMRQDARCGIFLLRYSKGFGAWLQPFLYSLNLMLTYD